MCSTAQTQAAPRATPWRTPAESVPTPKRGFWFSLYFDATLFASPGWGSGSCNVSRVLVPTSGDGSVPLSFQAP